MPSYYFAEYDAFIHYHKIGTDTPTIVYLPGLSTASSALFLPVVGHPTMCGHSALLIDYLGSGFSDQPADFDHSMQHHAETIAAILDAENVRDCTLIGHSMGGTVGIMLAKLRPDLVARLIVAESNILAGGGVGTSYIASFSEEEYVNQIHPAILTKARDKAKEGDISAGFTVMTWQAVDPVGVYRSSQALVHLPDEFATTFFALPMPRLFIYGERSLAENIGKSRGDTPDPDLLRQHGITVGIVPNSGHNMILDNLAGFVELLQQGL